MTQTPAGWYPDPWNPRVQRYWDGQQWTQHVHDAAAASATGEPADALPLADWVQRLGAYLIDGLVVGAAGLLLGLPLWLRYFRAVRDFADASTRAADRGATPPGADQFVASALGPLLGAIGVSLVVLFVYQFAFLRWRQQTLGKMALGIEVREVGSPGLSSGRILARIAMQFLPGVVLSGLYSLLDDLWPLWDPRRQSLHDKVAGTLVVKRR